MVLHVMLMDEDMPRVPSYRPVMMMVSDGETMIMVMRTRSGPSAERRGKFDKIVLPKNLFDNKITLINYGARFDMRRDPEQR